MKCISNI